MQDIFRVIFFINAQKANCESVRLKLEDLTNCKVYTFKSFEEASLYTALNPNLIIYTSVDDSKINLLSLPKSVKIINLSQRSVQTGKEHIRPFSNLKEILDIH